jgi:phosphoribosylformylglycinamidine cyclo-ligase
VPSAGLHTNGYSLARRIVFDTLKLGVDSYVPDLQQTVADALLEPHSSYLPVVQPLLDATRIKGMAHYRRRHYRQSCLGSCRTARRR